MFDDWTVIHRYTRAQAIADGVLVDVTEQARETGFKFPVALTRAVWEDCVAWSDADTNRKAYPQSESGRLWDVLWMARLAAMRARGPETLYKIVRVPRDGRAIEVTEVQLKIHIGPGDTPDPVITIMQPNED